MSEEWGGRIKFAFDYARDTTKQVLTLCAAILTVSITFLSDVAGDRQLGGWIALLYVSWALLLVSALFGVFVLLQMTGEASPTDKDKKPKSDSPSIYQSGIVRFARCQIALFVLGLLTLAVFGAVVAVTPQLADVAS